MSLREAAQQALEALEDIFGKNKVDVGAINALRAALAKSAQDHFRDATKMVQEPVAWMVYTLDGKSVCVTDNPADFTQGHRALPLYTAPPKREPMTEQQLDEMFDTAEIAIYLAERQRAEHLEVYSFGVRDAEKWHGIGGEE